MISVIIPVINEAKTIEKLTNYLFKHGNNRIEVLIVDGGSSDLTVDIAKNAGATVIQSPKKGRAIQMNVGAMSAKYEVLYFLHADSYPPTSFCEDILMGIENGYEAGCYRLAFDHDHPMLKFYCWFTRFDIDIFRFGDQSLYVQKATFNKAGRFDESLIVMEDQKIVRSLKKVTKFIIFSDSVSTSARKYEKIGIIKLQLIFTSVLIMYYLGMDQQKIVEYYFRKIR